MMKDKDTLTLKATPGSPITEADLHAYVDDVLSAGRRAEVDVFLTTHADARANIEAWTRQKKMLKQAYDPVADEAIPLRFAVRPPARPPRWLAAAAAVLMAVASGVGAWVVRGEWDQRAMAVRAPASPAAAKAGDLGGFVHRAAVAHAVYTPEVRRPVEVGADQEQALATWLTKRLGATVRPPHLGDVGYALVGGRLLPGGVGPVAQFMYSANDGRRLTLYVTREAAGDKSAFRFSREGEVNVFYWVDEQFGYALSGDIERAELLRVSEEVYRQLG